MAAIDKANTELNKLKAQSYAELAQLESYRKLPPTGDKGQIVSIWKDDAGAKELRIIVQVYRHYFLGIGRMTVLGFALDGAGNIRDLAQDELSDYR